MMSFKTGFADAIRRRSLSVWSRTRMPSRVLAGLMSCVLVLAASVLPRDAAATLVTVNTTTLLGSGATLEFSLFDGDGTLGNNSVTISSLSTNGAFVSTDCSLGCTGGPPYVITDLLGFGQFLQNMILGTNVSFDLSTTGNFVSNGTNVPDRLILSMLDTGSSFTLVDTNLDFLNDAIPAQDALLIADLAPGVSYQLPTATTPGIVITIGVVPEPGSMALMALGLLLLPMRKRRTAA